MNQTLLFAGVDLIPVLVVEESSDILESFLDGTPDGRPACISSLARANLEMRIKRTYLCYALPGEDVAHIDRTNRRHCRDSKELKEKINRYMLVLEMKHKISKVIETCKQDIPSPSSWHTFSALQEEIMRSRSVVM